MIDLDTKTGRELAHFMYEELEKIARGPSIADLRRMGIEVSETLRTQKRGISDFAPGRGFFERITSQPQSRTNRDLRRSKDSILKGLNSRKNEGLRKIRQGDVEEGSRIIREADEAISAITSLPTPKAPKVVKPPVSVKPPKAAPERSPTLGERFDRVANLTGKGVIGAGTAAGAYGLYQASQPSSPYGYG